MNQELQSTNEEMETVNDELRRRGTDLGRSNVFLESILRSVPLGVVVMDGDLVIELWNDVATDMWGLRQDEVRGTHFLGLDIGLPVQYLRQPLNALRHDSGEPLEVVLDAINRRGRAIKVRVTCAHTGSERRDSRGVVVVMQELDPQAAAGDAGPPVM
jgi:two-component system CheB/CheR fusion protein